jgi:hypothetical protein
VEDDEEEMIGHQEVTDDLKEEDEESLHEDMKKEEALDRRLEMTKHLRLLKKIVVVREEE